MSEALRIAIKISFENNIDKNIDKNNCTYPLTDMNLYLLLGSFKNK